MTTVPAWIVQLVRVGDTAESVEHLAVAWAELERSCNWMEPYFAQLDELLEVHGPGVLS